MSPAYYNEHDPFAAAWLRSLIAAGHIAPGDVDERSITDVQATDLVGYGQCHFFAGIGGWSLALRLAGVPDDVPVWTGSCPCQPFSSAGKGAGTADARHLWPELRRLIAERRPSAVFGEQVASGLGRTWLSAVRADLEELGYGVGAADLCAAGVGAPHIRQRLWWGGVGVADARGQRLDGIHALLRADAAGRVAGDLLEAAGGGGAGGLANGDSLVGDEGRSVGGGRDPGGDAQPWAGLGGAGVAGGVGNSLRNGRQQSGRDSTGLHASIGEGAADVGGDAGSVSGPDRPRPPHVDWRSADWLRCRDGKWRPVEPGACPLVDGVPARVGRLRGYGNAIVPQAGAAFVTAFLEAA